MGKNAVQFACHHCNHCCTEVICLPTPYDVIRIVRETGRDPLDFLEFLEPPEVEDVRQNDPTWLKVGGKRYLMALKRDISGCFFLNKQTRFCSIYNSRPLLCRLYPFKLLETRDGQFKGFSLHKDVGCPRHRDGVVATKPLYDIYLEDRDHQDDYEDLVRIFNLKRNPDKKPEQFVDLFICREIDDDLEVRTA
jgi:Fe-S-cluster containining protein